MATSTAQQTLNATSSEIVNTIINGTPALSQSVPLIDGTNSYKEIGAIITTDNVFANAFLSALFNRIGKVFVSSKLYNNPLAKFKKGLLENGEVIEDIYVNLVIGKLTNWENSDDINPFERHMPDVRSTFYPINLKCYYPVTVTLQELKTAFLSAEGITDLVGKIVNAMYTSANLDEFFLMKYVLAKAILNGNVRGIQIPEFTTRDDMLEIISTVKSTANKMTFMRKDFNAMEVQNFCDISDQHVLIQADFEARMDVNVLASAFNMDKADFMGHRNLIDSFGTIDNERLSAIIDNYIPLTQSEIEVLDAIPCVLIDKDFFQIYDVTMEFTEQYNPRKMYWNYFLHIWKVACFSPFMNSAVFVNGEPEVTSVTLSPSAMALTVGQKGQLSATVVTENFASQNVVYTSSSESKATVDVNGTVTALATGSVTITATSVADSTKKATCVITIS